MVRSAIANMNQINNPVSLILRQADSQITNLILKVVCYFIQKREMNVSEKDINLAN